MDWGQTTKFLCRSIDYLQFYFCSLKQKLDVVGHVIRIKQFLFAGVNSATFIEDFSLLTQLRLHQQPLFSVVGGGKGVSQLCMEKKKKLVMKIALT